MTNYEGSCHCGNVTFRYESAPVPVLECNCSICRRKGAIWQAVRNESFEILSGRNDLSLYQFGSRTAKHFFCRHCGVSTFSNPRIAPDSWVVNLRCVDDVDVASLTIVPFDGRHWEQAAQELMKRLKASDRQSE